MNKMQQQVEEFHLAFGHPVETAPQLPSSELGALRVALIQEELDELKAAFEMGDIVEAVDAIADLLYVVFGTASVLGVDAEPIYDAVHDSNMDKLGSDGRPVPHASIPGKIGKRPGWTAPDLAPLIAAQAGDRP